MIYTLDLRANRYPSPVAALAPNSGLLPADAKETALVDQWVHYAESEVENKQQFISGLVKGRITPYNKPVSFCI